MTLSAIRERAIAPALALLPARMSSPQAEIMLLAIGLQESRLIHQHQIGGPAHGLWQFEEYGGVKGVFRHPASKELALMVCRARGIKPTINDLFEALDDEDDVLDAAFARLLLWTDPRPLPAIHDVAGAWELYLRTWRPGKPHRHTWDALYARAVREVV